MFYSKSTGGFYDPAINGSSIPADAVEISSQQHAQLLAEQAAGKRIEADLNGFPVAVELPPPTFADIKAAQVQTITKACELELTQITGSYPPSELASWDSQCAEAVAWTANNATPTPLLSAIVAVNGATMSDQAASVLTKAAAFKAASGAAIGKRQKLTDQINAAPDVATVQAIVW